MHVGIGMRRQPVARGRCVRQEWKSPASQAIRLSDAEAVHPPAGREFGEEAGLTTIGPRMYTLLVTGKLNCPKGRRNCARLRIPALLGTSQRARGITSPSYRMETMTWPLKRWLQTWRCPFPKWRGTVVCMFPPSVPSRSYGRQTISKQLLPASLSPGPRRHRFIVST